MVSGLHKNIDHRFSPLVVRRKKQLRRKLGLSSPRCRGLASELGSLVPHEWCCVPLPSPNSSREKGGSGFPSQCGGREGAGAPGPRLNVPGAGLRWGPPSEGPCLCFSPRGAVSPPGWALGRARKMHPGFCRWFRLWTSCPFRACVIAGISKSSLWKLKFTENILTRAKQQLQGCLKGLNFVPESPLQRLALNTSFPKKALCSVTELSASLSLLILVIMYHTWSLRRIIISFSGIQWTVQIQHFRRLILLGKKIAN